MITAGDKGGYSHTPPKAEGMEQPGPCCPKCRWGVSRAVKAEDRTVVVECINANCDYSLTMLPGGIKDETHKDVPEVRSSHGDALLFAEILRRVRSSL